MKNPKVIAAFLFNSELIFYSWYAHCTVKNTILAKAHSLLTLKKICKETEMSASPVCTWQQCMAMCGRDTKAGSVIQKSRSVVNSALIVQNIPNLCNTYSTVTAKPCIWVTGSLETEEGIHSRF